MKQEPIDTLAKFMQYLVNNPDELTEYMANRQEFLRSFLEDGRRQKKIRKEVLDSLYKRFDHEFVLKDSEAINYENDKITINGTGSRVPLTEQRHGDGTKFFLNDVLIKTATIDATSIKISFDNVQKNSSLATSTVYCLTLPNTSSLQPINGSTQNGFLFGSDLNNLGLEGKLCNISGDSRIPNRTVMFHGYVLHRTKTKKGDLYIKFREIDKSPDCEGVVC